MRRAALTGPPDGTLQEWSALAEGTLDFAAQSALDQQTRSLRFLVIDTAHDCNLTCPGMCYYHEALRQTPAPLVDFQRAIRDAAETLSLGVLTLAGKEPLLDIRRFEALAQFATPPQGRSFRVGAVTNGVLISRHARRLDALAEAAPLDFLDVSLDSASAEQHDAIRGAPGAHAAATLGLQHALTHWPQTRVGTASVLRPDNSQGLLDLVRGMDRRLRSIFIFPLQTPVFHGGRGLSWAQLEDFVLRLRDVLSEDRRGDGLEVTVSLLGLHLPDAVAAGLLNPLALEEDELGQVFTQQDVGGNRLIFLLQVLPETGRHSLRILPSGDVLPNTHYLQAADRNAFVVGNIGHASLSEIRFAATGPQSALQQLWRSRERHSCRTRPCWSACFGGLAVADHQVVGRAPLDNQPRLCSLAEADLG